MKKVVLTVLAAVAAIGVQAQGFVNFVTTNSTFNFKVFDVDHTTALSGSSFYTQLYAADGNNIASSSLTAKGNPVNFRVNAFAGYVQTTGSSQPNNILVNTSVQVTALNGVDPGNTANVTVQMRAWSSAFSTYALAVQNNAKYGQSAALNMALVGGAATPGMDAFSSFSLQQSPEPTTIALGLMGAASLLIVRRRK